jgi:F-box/TPR repeat protein Pof3
MSTSHMLLTALDHRAATYEKLEQLQPALKDAKQMIELKPELSKVTQEIVPEERPRP